MRRMMLFQDERGKIFMFNKKEYKFSQNQKKNMVSIWESNDFRYVITSKKGISVCDTIEEVLKIIQETFHILFEDVPIVCVENRQQFHDIVTKKTNITCPTCGSNNLIKWGTHDSPAGKTKRKKCKDCGHVWNVGILLPELPVIKLISDASDASVRTETRKEAETPYVSC